MITTEELQAVSAEDGRLVRPQVHWDIENGGYFARATWQPYGPSTTPYLAAAIDLKPEEPAEAIYTKLVEIFEASPLNDAPMQVVQH